MKARIKVIKIIWRGILTYWRIYNQRKNQIKIASEFKPNTNWSLLIISYINIESYQLLVFMQSVILIVPEL